MEKRLSVLYGILLAVSILLGIAGALTLVPRSGASYPNILGYSSLCTFAPAASFFCFTAAGIVCFLRASMVRDREGALSERLARHLKKAAIPVLLVFLLGIASTFWFVSVKSQYTADGGTAASEEN